MNRPALTVGLVAGERVAEVVPVPEAVLWRMARRAQSRALAAGVRGACHAEFRLLGHRGLPGLASAMEIRITGQSGIFAVELPTAALEPLIAGPAANLRADMGLPNEVAISYLVLRPREEGDAPVWAKMLPAFVAVPADLARGRALFPALAWAEDAPIVINEDALRQCADACRDPVVERGGALLGRVCLSRNGGAGERLWTQVVAFALAVGAAADATRLTFNAEAWSSIQRHRAAIEAEAGLGQPLHVVGWVHGHPRLAEAGGSPFFLSPQDVATTAQHFAEPFACALVFDAQAEAGTALERCFMAFGWDGCGVSLTPRSLDLYDGHMT